MDSEKRSTAKNIALNLKDLDELENQSTFIPLLPYYISILYLLVTLALSFVLSGSGPRELQGFRKKKLLLLPDISSDYWGFLARFLRAMRFSENYWLLFFGYFCL